MFNFFRCAAKADESVPELSSYEIAGKGLALSSRGPHNRSDRSISRGAPVRQREDEVASLIPNATRRPPAIRSSAFMANG
jgi:hypothetical protein